MSSELESSTSSGDVSTERDPQTHAIIGAAIEVHRHLGPGFLEAVYHESLAIELAARGIPANSKSQLAVHYKGSRLECCYIPDLICFDNIIVEVKAVAAITTIEQAQLLNYLKITGFERGIILNFGQTRLEIKRMRGSSPRQSVNGEDVRPND